MINPAAVQVVKAYKKLKDLAQKLYKKVSKFAQCLEETEKLVGITFVEPQHILHFLTNLWPELLQRITASGTLTEIYSGTVNLTMQVISADHMADDSTSHQGKEGEGGLCGQGKASGKLWSGRSNTAGTNTTSASGDKGDRGAVRSKLKRN